MEFFFPTEPFTRVIIIIIMDRFVSLAKFSSDLLSLLYIYIKLYFSSSLYMPLFYCSHHNSFLPFFFPFFSSLFCYLFRFSSSIRTSRIRMYSTIWLMLSVNSLYPWISFLSTFDGEPRGISSKFKTWETFGRAFLFLLLVVCTPVPIFVLFTSITSWLPILLIFETSKIGVSMGSINKLSSSVPEEWTFRHQIQFLFPSWSGY